MAATHPPDTAGCWQSAKVVLGLLAAKRFSEPTAGCFTGKVESNQSKVLWVVRAIDPNR